MEHFLKMWDELILLLGAFFGHADCIQNMQPGEGGSNKHGPTARRPLFMARVKQEVNVDLFGHVCLSNVSHVTR